MDDLISRKAARKALCKAVHKGEPIPCDNQTCSCLWSKTRVCDYAREIDNLPPAQQWIPCDERLPERPEQVLVYAMNTHFSIAKYKEIRKGVNEYVEMWVTDNAFDVPHEIKGVLAWMPLPEPYEEDES